ncbi:aa3-type cytochrome c oxidase subunit IV [Sphingobium aquiterrae]
MASGNDMKSATETYAGFVGLMKWGTVACVAVAALVILLISS